MKFPMDQASWRSSFQAEKVREIVENHMGLVGSKEERSNSTGDGTRNPLGGFVIGKVNLLQKKEVVLD